MTPDGKTEILSQKEIDDLINAVENHPENPMRKIEEQTEDFKKVNQLLEIDKLKKEIEELKKRNDYLRTRLLEVTEKYEKLLEDLSVQGVKNVDKDSRGFS